MHLTQHTDYALRSLMYVAANPNKLVNIGAIAECYGISQSHLMKVAAALVKKGFLESVRGKGGGVRLAKAPEAINIGEVVRQLEPVKWVECMGRQNSCLLTSCCGLTGMLNGGAEAFLRHLDQFTLVDLLNQPTLALLYQPEISA